jgi:SAM-dependent methyltransferase
MGRNSYWAMRSGAAGGVAIDLDERSLSAARRNLAVFPSLRVERQNIYELPYQENFDIAFSIGVIHHLEDPARAMRVLVRSVKKGGRVLIWVYGRENNGWAIYGLNPMRKLIFSRLPIRWVHALSIGPAGLLWLLLRLEMGHLEYLRFLRRSSFPYLRAIVFDQMLPRIAHYWPQATVRRLMEEAGLVDVSLRWVNELSWSAVGMRP